jgi:hypothetical protein
VERGGGEGGEERECEEDELKAAHGLRIDWACGGAAVECCGMVPGEIAGRASPARSSQKAR